MPQIRPKALIESTLFSLAALCLVVGVWALGFLQDVSREDRALLIIASSLGLIASFASLILVRFLWRWLRKRTRQKVLSAWQERNQSKTLPTIDAAQRLSEGALRVLAIQLFGQIGYGVLHKDEDDGYVHLLNPEGQLELVVCKRQASPVDIKPIYEFYMDLKRAGAAQGFFLATGGFTPEASYWARQKPILLENRRDIGRLIDCVQAHRSLFLK